MERKTTNNRRIVKAALVMLRRWYRGEVKAIAEQFALQFQARKFDETVQDENEDPRFMALEDHCEQLPLCTDRRTALVALACSRYANAVAFFYVESCTSHPNPGETWRDLAAWCLARDVHDEAIARGWSVSRAERSDSPYFEDREKRRRRRDAAARSRAL
jgi:hypothetical protein